MNLPVTVLHLEFPFSHNGRKIHSIKWRGKYNQKDRTIQSCSVPHHDIFSYKLNNRVLIVWMVVLVCARVSVCAVCSVSCILLRVTFHWSCYPHYKIVWRSTKCRAKFRSLGSRLFLLTLG